MSNSREILSRKFIKDVSYSIMSLIVLIVFLIYFSFMCGEYFAIRKQNIIRYTLITNTTDPKGVRQTHDEIVFKLFSNNNFKWKDYGLEDGYYSIGIKRNDITTSTLKLLK